MAAKERKNKESIKDIFARRLLSVLGDGHRVLLAVSGGVDSVVMGWLFHDYLKKQKKDWFCAVAHANFGLRGTASQADGLLVERLAAGWQFPFYTRRFSPKDYAKRHRVSLQMACRTLRYAWFHALCKAHSLHCIATAHHQEDDVETALLQLAHGRAPLGRLGMPVRRSLVVRPLLSLSREQIMTYATQNQLIWREDASNRALVYARNRIRQEVLPILRGINPAIAQSFAHLKVQGDHVHALVQERLAAFEAAHVTRRKDYQCLRLPVGFLSADRPHKEALLWCYLQHYQLRLSAFPSLLKALAQGQTGKRFTTATHEILLDRARVFLYPKGGTLSEMPPAVLLHEGQERLVFGRHVLHFRKYPASQRTHHAATASGRHPAYLAYETLHFPLMVRAKQVGDHFFPLGMTGKKRLGKYMVDEKVPRCLKGHVPLLLSEGKIAWVGWRSRVDSRFYPKEDSCFVYEVRLSDDDWHG